MNTPPSLRAHSPLTRADFHAAQGVLLVVRNPPPAPPPVKAVSYTHLTLPTKA